MPNKIKLPKLAIKLAVDILKLKSPISGAGLQGSTIRPKNKPKRKALNVGLPVIGECHWPKNLVKSTLNIRSKLTRASTLNAIGEAILITLVKLACRKKLKKVYLD